MKPYRNVFCPFYSECLDQAAMKQLPGFSCRGCEHIDLEEIEDDIGRAEFNLLLEVFTYIFFKAKRVPSFREKPDEPDPSIYFYRPG